MSIKKAFDEITPTYTQKDDMLRKIKEKKDVAIKKQQRRRIINRFCVASAACFSVIICMVAIGIFVNSTGKPISVSGDRNSNPVLNSNMNSIPESSKIDENASSVPETEPSTETTTEVTETMPPETSPVTEQPALIIENAENITLKFTGDVSFTQRGLLYLIAVDDDFIYNDKVLDMTGRMPSEEFYINTEHDGTKYLESIQCGLYVVTGPCFCTTGASGYSVVNIDISMSGTTVEIDLNTPDIAPEKVNDGQNSDITLRDLTKEERQSILNIFKEEIWYNGKKYLPVDAIPGVSDYKLLAEARKYLAGYGFDDHLVPEFRSISDTFINQQYNEGLNVKLYSIKKSVDCGYDEELYYILVNGKLYDSEEFSEIALLRKVDIPYINSYTHRSFFYKIYIDADIIGDCKEIYYGEEMCGSFHLAYYDETTASSFLRTENGEMITNKKVIFRYINGIEYYNYIANNQKPHLKNYNRCLCMDVDSNGNMTAAIYYHWAQSGFYLGVLTREDAIKMGGYPIYRVGDDNFFEYMLTIPYEQFPDLCDDLSELDKSDLYYNGDYEYPDAE